jgi:hypothetical protein
MKSVAIATVKDFCNDQEYDIPVDGRRSFAPGEIALAASYTGTRGEILVAGATSDRRGASAFSVNVQVRSAGFVVQAPSNCPVPISGRSYLGIYVDTAESMLHAWLYSDGAFQSVLGSISYAGLLSGSFDVLTWQRVHTQGDTVIVQGRQSLTDRIVTWNVTGDTLAIADTGIGTIAGPVWPASGTDVYFTESFLSFPDDEQVLQLRKAALGATGLLDYEASKVGDPIQDPELSSPTILCATSSTWEVPSFDDPGSDQVACPYFSGGAWLDGRGRVLANPTNPGAHGNGYRVSNGRSARAMFLESGAYSVGLLPAGPGSPETALIPDSWGLPSGFHLSVSPAGSELALYPVVMVGDSPPNDKLLRLPLAGISLPEGCDVPRITVEPGPNDQVPDVMLCRD